MSDRNEGSESTEVALIDSIGTAELKELGRDLGKFTIDMVLEEELVKSVPIIGTIVRTHKLFVSIRDRLFLQKVLIFLDEFTNVPGDVRQRFVADLERDAGTRAKAGSTLILILDRLDDLEKPKLIGRLYHARLKGLLTFDELRRFCMIVERAYLPDLVALSKLRPGDQVDDLAAPYLSALGIVTLTGEDFGTLDGVGAKQWHEVNDFGRRFLSILL